MIKLFNYPCTFSCEFVQLHNFEGMAAESQLTELMLAEGRCDDIDPIPIVITSSEIAQADNCNIDNGENNDNDMAIGHDEGQLAMCHINDCNQVSVHQCSVCNENICNDHATKIGNSDIYECNSCISIRLLQDRRNINRNIARCCIKRFIVRLLVFVILVIIASIYASSSKSGNV